MSMAPWIHGAFPSLGKYEVGFRFDFVMHVGEV